VNRKTANWSRNDGRLISWFWNAEDILYIMLLMFSDMLEAMSFCMKLLRTCPKSKFRRSMYISEDCLTMTGTK